MLFPANSKPKFSENPQIELIIIEPLLLPPGKGILATLVIGTSHLSSPAIYTAVNTHYTLLTYV